MKKIHYLLIGVLIVNLSACKREIDSNPALQAKAITAVTFTTADNPLLTSDISGSVSNDSIRISFPAHVNLGQLIPTITHDGESISPASKTVQNFSSPVVYTVTAKNGSTKNYAFAARHTSMNDSINLLSGKWRVVKDSVAVFNFCYSCNGGPCWIPIPGHIRMANDCLPHYFNILTLNTNAAVFHFTHSKPNGGYWNRMVWLAR